MEKRTFQDLMSIKKVTAIEHCYQRVETLQLLQPWNITRTGITCKKTPCYMCDSDCKWRITKNAKIL